MSVKTRAMASEYLHWAKMHSAAKYNLATSGIMSYPLAALPVTMSELEINGPNPYGYVPLKEQLAAKFGITPQQVMATNGTSMANHLAMAAVLSPGDDVLAEMPTYGLLLEVASYLGANIHRFERRLETDFQIDVEDVRAKVTPKTKLIVLTNLHNPSGALTSEETLAELGRIADQVGAYVLVDEVYLDMVSFDGLHAQPRSSIHIGPQFIVTSSLTKAYGLSGIRSGFILAEPGLTERIWRLNDLFNATPVHPGELIGVAALDHLEQVRARAAKLLHANRTALDAFLEGCDDLEVFRPIAGTVVFPKLKHAPNDSADGFCAFLRNEYETSVVPGRFFEMPQYFRIGLGGDVAMTAAALERLGAALDAYARR